ncbi:MAG: tetratricopeptide repeat protein [Bacteroidota bacterium]
MLEIDIPKNKLEGQNRIINQILTKNSDTMLPRFSILLGAGCSYSSGIPLGGGVISILRKLTFLEYQKEFLELQHHYHNDFQKYLFEIDRIISSSPEKFEAFVGQFEERIRKEISLSQLKNLFPDHVKARTSDKSLESIREHVFWDQIYGSWFEKFSSDPRKRQELIEKIIEDIKPNGAYILLANIIEKGFINNIFTTNFDDLVNEALLRYVDIKARVFSHNELAQYLRISTRKPNIIKLHGDYLYENIKNIKSETDQLDKKLQDKFKQALSTNGLIVIGYNGGDNSIMSVLENLQRTQPFTLYWCGMNVDRAHWRVKRLISKSSNSFFVQIKNFEAFIYDLWRAADKPLKNDFIEKAKKAKSEMTNFIKDFENQQVKRSKKIFGEISVTELNEIKGIDILSDTLSMIDVNQRVSRYQILLDLNPHSTDLLNNFAVELIKLRDFEKAISLLNEVISIEPNYKLAHFNLAVALHDLRNKIDSEKHLLEALSIDDDFYQAHNNLGVLYNSKKDYTRALDSFSMALKICPDNGRILVNKGIVNKNLGNFNLAIELYDQAIEIGDHIERAYYNKANALRLWGKLDSALPTALHALKLDGDNEYAHGTLAEIYASLSMDVEFYSALETALKKGYPAWDRIESDPAYRKYIDAKKFQELIEDYKI